MSRVVIGLASQECGLRSCHRLRQLNVKDLARFFTLSELEMGKAFQVNDVRACWKILEKRQRFFAFLSVNLRSSQEFTHPEVGRPLSGKLCEDTLSFAVIFFFEI